MRKLARAPWVQRGRAGQRGLKSAAALSRGVQFPSNEIPLVEPHVAAKTCGPIPSGLLLTHTHVVSRERQRQQA